MGRFKYTTYYIMWEDKKTIRYLHDLALFGISGSDYPTQII